MSRPWKVLYWFETVEAGHTPWGTAADLLATRDILLNRDCSYRLAYDEPRGLWRLDVRRTGATLAALGHDEPRNELGSAGSTQASYAAKQARGEVRST